jgi:hypothetical protein
MEGGKVSATPGSIFLSATLNVANDLVQHWSALNGCPNVNAHINPHTLCVLADAISFLLRGFELAIEAVNKSKMSSHRNHHHYHYAAADHVAASTMDSRAKIGRLELDPSEAAIVVQESLKHSILRLATMSQDVAEEAALIAQRNHDVAHPLKDRDVKGLITRLFVALASVDRMGT